MMNGKDRDRSNLSLMDIVEIQYMEMVFWDRSGVLHTQVLSMGYS